ncbi:Zinc finger, C3HC4 type (RING finger) [Carpediemonas membranifera]|uniref:Zinc finger, C3HC4 type (RING finger) n=1 Tax=Carpediemonas membranifera TaxID=201153 RepID=A0A8J6B8N1_9EUKA|nr:Zinc finger, C3HC4 type (RING finger) [Carpediemonas membranifera]|eukprot:KAG9396529.1 Zinc finger, C3HC4 type (RING finger) [Carpediemonas membranifera]
MTCIAGESRIWLGAKYEPTCHGRLMGSDLDATTPFTEQDLGQLALMAVAVLGVMLLVAAACVAVMLLGICLAGVFAMFGCAIVAICGYFAFNFIIWVAWVRRTSKPFVAALKQLPLFILFGYAIGLRKLAQHVERVYNVRPFSSAQAQSPNAPPSLTTQRPPSFPMGALIACSTDELKDAGLFVSERCVVDMEEPSTVALMPCGHVCVCPSCYDGIAATGVGLCPMCRARIEAAIDMTGDETEDAAATHPDSPRSSPARNFLPLSRSSSETVS